MATLQEITSALAEIFSRKTSGKPYRWAGPLLAILLSHVREDTQLFERGIIEPGAIQKIIGTQAEQQSRWQQFFWLKMRVIWRK